MDASDDKVLPFAIYTRILKKEQDCYDEALERLLVLVIEAVYPIL